MQIYLISYGIPRTSEMLLEIDIYFLISLPSYRWKTLFYYVQKSHYKSSNIAKLLVAVQIYRGLIDISSIRFEVTQKLISMLTHPFPKACIIFKVKRLHSDVLT